jgi:nucleotide-binding universal stress UspA family protein
MHRSDRQLEVYETFARDLIRDHQWGSAAKPIARILVPTDFSVCSMWALRYAEELARRFGAEIVLLHVDQALAPGSELAQTRHEASREELDGLVTLLGRRDVPARKVLRFGGPAEEVLSTAEAEDADLIVMGTHGRTGMAHVLMGSVAENVMRRSPCPVLTVRQSGRV